MGDEIISYLGLGSNLGDSRALIEEAIERLARWSSGPVRRSSLWRSDPVDCPPGSPAFVNAVAAIRPLPGWNPERLLGALQELERAFGRRPKTVRNEARPLDLDILSWGREIRHSAALSLPHPRAHRRAFVLAPWAEIAPRLVLPGQVLTVRELWDALEEREGCVRIGAEEERT